MTTPSILRSRYSLCQLIDHGPIKARTVDLSLLLDPFCDSLRDVSQCNSFQCSLQPHAICITVMHDTRYTFPEGSTRSVFPYSGQPQGFARRRSAARASPVTAARISAASSDVRTISSASMLFPDSGTARHASATTFQFITVSVSTSDACAALANTDKPGRLVPYRKRRQPSPQPLTAQV